MVVVTGWAGVLAATTMVGGALPTVTRAVPVTTGVAVAADTTTGPPGRLLAVNKPVVEIVPWVVDAKAHVRAGIGTMSMPN